MDIVYYPSDMRCDDDLGLHSIENDQLLALGDGLPLFNGDLKDARADGR